MVSLSNQFKISNCPPAFILDLKYWYLNRTIPFLKCPLIPTKNGNVFSQGIIHLGDFLAIPHYFSHLNPMSRKKTEGHM